jgi:pyruvate dehydrogenase E1 component
MPIFRFMKDIIMNDTAEKKLDHQELEVIKQEWIDSLNSLYENEHLNDVQEILNSTFLHYINNNKTGIVANNSGYINTIDCDSEISYPGDLVIEQKISAYIRWNAIATILNANSDSTELGGHIASYASSAVLYDVGMNHFWQSNEYNHDNGDLVFFQGHISPGIYARSFVEGRFSEENLLRFRQESRADDLGLSSYPHPWLMPEYWQFPTVSMGLGPLMAISQAKILKYLQSRKLVSQNNRKVWCFLGDGETSEPESLGNLHIATKDKLDNLIFVVNCNLQRLDGLVHGNGKIIQDLEGVFLGAGWTVIKVIWSSSWDQLIQQDIHGKLKDLLLQTNDGEYQNLGTKDSQYLREQFFGKYEETKALVANLTDQDLQNLTRGGHDYIKIYNAYYNAVNNTTGKPVVILVKTTKGYGMKGEGESQNVAHQQKKLSVPVLQYIRDKFNLPITNQQLETYPLPFLAFDKNSEEYKYLKACRQKLGGDFPIRKVSDEKLTPISLEKFNSVITNTKEMSTTMAFVRMLSIMIKEPSLGKRIVPIIPDEARTFGMEGLFKQLGIWSAPGQLYISEDANHLMGYKESQDGQILQEGINEAGAMSTWMALASSYANNNIPMIPFYIYYSMFGFQRVGDLAWASGDMRCRGFLLGATAGRTTLSGEGLQHEDGHSHIQAALIPNCDSFDPTFAYELAIIINHGIKEMYQELKDKFYYITLMNQSYVHYSMPVETSDLADQIIKGGYLLSRVGISSSKLQVNILSCGVILIEAIKAAKMLWEDFEIASNIYSITSFNNLGRDIKDYNRNKMFDVNVDKPYVAKLLSNSIANVSVAATDYIRAYAEQIREYVPTKYLVLGTDGFGRSDYRAKLRNFFEVDSYHIAWACIKGLFDQNIITDQLLLEAKNKYLHNHINQAPYTV